MTKRTFLHYLLLFLFVCPILYGAQNFQEQFAQANELYKQTKFDAAYNLYKQIPEKNAQVYYNMGNCAYKLNKLGYALLYWKRAENDWGLFNRSELQSNIALVKDKLKKTQHEPKRIGTNRIVHAIPLVGPLKNATLSIVRTTPLIWLQLLFLIIWFFLFVSLRYLYAHKQKAIITFLFLIIAICGSTLVIKYNMRSRIYGIVVNPRSSLLSGPGDTYQTILQLPEGSSGKIHKHSDGYYKITIHGQIGWINQKNFKKI
ncbi:MAG: hypothetical protein ABH827_05345 [bacterium]